MTVVNENLIVEPQCLSCLKAWGFPWPHCLAFPSQDIPLEIREGKFDHRQPWPVSDEYPNGDLNEQYEQA